MSCGMGWLSCSLQYFQFSYKLQISWRQACWNEGSDHSKLIKVNHSKLSRVNYSKMSEINNSKLHEVNYKVNYSKLNFLFSGTEKENYGTH